MKKNLLFLRQFRAHAQRTLLFVLLTAPAFFSNAQVNLTNASNTYTQNFSSLGTSSQTWSNNSTIAGWYAASTNLATNGLVASTGSSTTGNLFNFGSSGTPADRALGSLASGSTNTLNYGVQIKNNGTTNITSIQITYTGEQWRNGGNTTAQKLTFDYSTSSLSISSGTYTAVTALDFTSLINTATAAALDGNLAANRTSGITATITGLSIAPSSSVMLRWTDLNDAGNDHGLAIDDITITATFCSAPTLSSSITNVTCNGDSDGAIDLTATGGTSPFTYAWTKSGGGFSASTEDISGLSAGTYNITLTANGGCTTSTSYTVTEPAALSPIVTTTSACDSYTWPVNGNVYSNSGTYSTTIGCQQYILDLTITPVTSNTTTISACDSYTWPVNGSTYTVSDTYTSVNGCHTEILDLTITASSTNTTSITQCDSYTWPVNGSTYTVSDTYTYVNNCHTEVLDLTIIPSSTNVTSVTACNNYTWSVNGQTYTNSDTYLDVVGCHTEELDLTIVTGTAPAKPNPVSGQQFNLCNVSGDKTYTIATVPDATSYTWTAPAGTSIVSGNGTNSIVLNITSGFTDGQISVTADNLCGSSLPRTFFIHAKPSKPVISGPTCVSANQTNITYTVANAEAGVTYTWKVPGVVRIISGQGTSSIVVDWRSTNGAIQCVPSNACATGAKGALNVAVGCTATASSSSQKILVNPNPSFGLTNIIFTSVKEIKYKLVLTDMSGRQLMAKELMASAGQNKISIDLSKYDNGIYMVSLISDEGVETTKIVKGQ